MSHLLDKPNLLQGTIRFCERCKRAMALVQADDATTTSITGEEALRIRDRHKNFGPHEVLKGISLTAHEHDVIAILGSGGSGKSTFLHCINLLEMPTPQRRADKDAPPP
jgi:ABC-type branched-subunit amino acid transport system ATPase component